MSYFTFLAVFLGIPLLTLVYLTRRDLRQGRRLHPSLRNLPYWGPLAVHVLLALTYTTPWDNYLVATGVWYYNPRLVTGLTLGWVPIEEYTFFVLQTLLTGLWLLYLGRRLTVPGAAAGGARWRWGATVVLGVIWLAALALLVSRAAPGIYLSLILVWALPPVMLQTAFGADLLWQQRKLVGLTLLTTTGYLAVSDSLAIGVGTWTIDPAQSLNWFIGGVLPFEELLFFFLTNVLITFGMTLALACASRERARRLFRWHALPPGECQPGGEYQPETEGA